MLAPGFASPEPPSARRCRQGEGVKSVGQGCLLDITNSPAATCNVTSSTTPLGNKAWDPGYKAVEGPGQAEEPAFITDETFDFDFVLSPTRQETGDEADVEEDEEDDEVFFGPLGHREKCIVVRKGLQQHQDVGPKPHWSPLKGDKFVQVCKEATLLALHMEKACVAGELSAVGHDVGPNRSRAKDRVVERFAEGVHSKIKVLQAVRALVPHGAGTPRQDTSSLRGPMDGTSSFLDRGSVGTSGEGAASEAGPESEWPCPLMGAQRLPSLAACITVMQASHRGGDIEARPPASCPASEDDTSDAFAPSSLPLPNHTKLRRPLGLRPLAPMGETRLVLPGQQKTSSSSSSGSCSSLPCLTSSRRTCPREDGANGAWNGSSVTGATSGVCLRGALRPPKGRLAQLGGGLPRLSSHSGQQPPASRGHPARTATLLGKGTGHMHESSADPSSKRVPVPCQPVLWHGTARDSGRMVTGGRGTPVVPGRGSSPAHHLATPGKDRSGGKLAEAGTPVQPQWGHRLSALGTVDRPAATFATPTKAPPRSAVPTPAAGSRGAVVSLGSTPLSAARRRSCIPAITPIRTPASLRPRRDAVTAAVATAVRTGGEGKTTEPRALSQPSCSLLSAQSLCTTTSPRANASTATLLRSPIMAERDATHGAAPAVASPANISLSPDSDIPLQSIVVNLFGATTALEQLESLLPLETFALPVVASGDLLCGMAAEKLTPVEERPLIDLSDSPEAGGGGGSAESKELIDLSSPLIDLVQKPPAECLLINIDSPLLKF